MKIYSNVSKYYEDKYFISLFAQYMHTKKIYAHEFTHFLKNKQK